MSRFDTIIAIDPGPVESAWCKLEESHGDGYGAANFQSNQAVMDSLEDTRDPRTLLAVEWLECQGAVVGAETFRTAFWIGRLVQAWGGPYVLVPRREVKLYLCASTKAKDAHVRAAVIGRLGEPGTAKKPGPTRGLTGHMWQAAGVALVTAASIWGNDGPKLEIHEA